MHKMLLENKFQARDITLKYKETLKECFQSRFAEAPTCELVLSASVALQIAASL